MSAAQPGRKQERWPQLLTRLRPAAADILLLCEAPAAGALLQSFAGKLEMAALPLPPSKSGIPVAILYRPSLGDPAGFCTDFSSEVTHGVIVAAFDVGLGDPLAVAVTHISPFRRRPRSQLARAMVGVRDIYLEYLQARPRRRATAATAR